VEGEVEDYSKLGQHRPNDEEPQIQIGGQHIEDSGHAFDKTIKTGCLAEA
jgi:hypothetical protein